MHKFSRETWVGRFEEVHGDKYDYPAEIPRSTEYFKVKCNKCNQYFYTNALRHYHSGHGCKCYHKYRGRERMTYDQWINRFRSLYGDNYEYPDKIEGANVEMKIWCKVHEIHFYKTPNHHYHNRTQCPQCSVDEIHDKWINRFEQVYGDKYTYLDDAINSNTNIKARCNICDTEFECYASEHWNGRECPKCSEKEKIKKRTKDWIKKFRAIHGDKFEYLDEVITSSYKAQTTIKCNDCGLIFKQRVDNHMQHSCPQCKMVKINRRHILRRESYDGYYRELIEDGTVMTLYEIRSLDTPYRILAYFATKLNKGSDLTEKLCSITKKLKLKYQTLHHQLRRFKHLVDKEYVEGSTNKQWVNKLEVTNNEKTTEEESV